MAAVYYMIRAGMRYDPVVLALKEPGTEPWSPGIRYFEYRSWAKRKDPNVFFFFEIDEKSAQMAFSGHADGWGWADRPKEPFNTLEEAEAWVKARHREARAESWKTLLHEVLADSLDELAEEDVLDNAAKKALLVKHGLLEQYEAKFGILSADDATIDERSE